MHKRPWTCSEKETVAKYYRRYPVEVLAHMLNRTPSSIRNYAAQMALRRGNYKEWTAAEETQLRETYTKKGLYITALRLGRTPDSVLRRASDLGIPGKRADRLSAR